MSSFIAVSSVTIVLFACLVTIVPSLRQSASWTSSQPVSQREAHIHALAAAQKYTPTTIFADPLMVYIDNFLSIEEIDHLLNSSSSLFVPSQVFTQDANLPQHRTSSSCSLPTEDLLPSVIAARAHSFLNSVSAETSYMVPKSLSYYGIEPLQLVKYGPSQYYHHHVDWFDALIRDDLPGKGMRGKGRGRLYNRVASFFFYLEDGCVGGGTEFPDLKLDESTIVAKDSEAAKDNNRESELKFWEERIEIKHDEDEISNRGRGIIFKPRKGSGVFWINLHESGFGDHRVRHAGMPVVAGQKVGMNIWVKRDFGW